MNNKDIKNKCSYNLFKTNIKASCNICQYSIGKMNSLFCSAHKRNINDNDSCDSFLYCPLKRQPMRKPIFNRSFKKKDFEI